MKKGFTLVELLSVIVILAVILLIAIPKINKRVLDGRQKSFLVTAKNVIRQLEYMGFDSNSEILSNVDLGDISTSNIILSESRAYIVNDEIYIDLAGSNDYDGMYICGVNASTKDANVQEEPCTNATP